MPKKPKRKTLTAALDRLVSLQVRAANNDLCEVCGQPANQVHHVVGRNNMRLRYDPRNLVSICPRCHLWEQGKIAYWVAPGGFTRFCDWFAANRPSDDFYLRDPDNTAIIHRSLGDLMDMRDELKKAA